MKTKEKINESKSPRSTLPGRNYMERSPPRAVLIYMCERHLVLIMGAVLLIITLEEILKI